MIDLARLQRIHLTKRPFGQKFVAWALLAPNYNALPGVKIRVEGFENLPDTPLIFAMNHTDRYNYWPFQYRLYRVKNRFTATWVKGKYYEHAFTGWFMEQTNNIPAVSRGYLITKDFTLTLGRRPTNEEYTALRTMATPGSAEVAPHLLETIPRTLFEQPRDILGRRFHPERETYPESIEALYRVMMQRFAQINAEAIAKGLDLIVFPQGTRSARLSRGHIGLAQIALHHRKTVVPVGCSGSDRAYPGVSPLAQKGEITYRIGKPIPYDEFSDYHIHEPFEPFTLDAETRHRERFQGAVDLIMDRINLLVDPDYRYSDGQESHGVSGSDRFL